MKQLRNFNLNKSVPKQFADSDALKETMDRFSGMDENALIEQLLVQVHNSRANGSYDAKQMEQYVAMLSPHLSETQREKMSNIVKIINSENV